MSNIEIPDIISHQDINIHCETQVKYLRPTKDEHMNWGTHQ